MGRKALAVVVSALGDGVWNTPGTLPEFKAKVGIDEHWTHRRSEDLSVLPSHPVPFEHGEMSGRWAGSKQYLPGEHPAVRLNPTNCIKIQCSC